MRKLRKSVLDIRRHVRFTGRNVKSELTKLIKSTNEIQNSGEMYSDGFVTYECVQNEASAEPENDQHDDQDEEKNESEEDQNSGRSSSEGDESEEESFLSANNTLCTSHVHNNHDVSLQS